MKQQITVRALIVYAVAIAVGWLLTEIVWGATGGVVMGLSCSRNPEYRQQVAGFLAAKGIDTHDRTAIRNSLARLPAADKQELEIMTRAALSDINWFAVTVFDSAVVFGLVGLLAGFISRTWFLAALLPCISFAINNPIVRFEMAKELAPSQKVVVVVVQFAACCLLALLGAGLVARRNRGAVGNLPESRVA